jgi:hypothetical protein
MIPLIHTHDCVLYWLGTGTAIKSGEDKLRLPHVGRGLYSIWVKSDE